MAGRSGHAHEGHPKATACCHRRSWGVSRSSLCICATVVLSARIVTVFIRRQHMGWRWPPSDTSDTVCNRLPRRPSIGFHRVFIGLKVFRNRSRPSRGRRSPPPCRRWMSFFNPQGSRSGPVSQSLFRPRSLPRGFCRVRRSPHSRRFHPARKPSGAGFLVRTRRRRGLFGHLPNAGAGFLQLAQQLVAPPSSSLVSIGIAVHLELGPGELVVR